MKNKLITLLLIVQCTTILAQNGFKTYFEESGYVSTESYDATISYFERIANHSEFAELKKFGVSPQGRGLYYLIIDGDKDFNLLHKGENKVTILIQNGIHSGEIEGKDACMLLVREMLIEKSKLNLMKNVRLVIIPIFNVDGHERTSPYNRINQNGPKEMGWRTTAQNFNLNRDYTKLDTPEMKALIKLLVSINPDIYVDTHTTDGADYQYTITYGIDDHLLIYKPQKEFINQKMRPFIERTVEQQGFLISPYVSYVKRDFRNGVYDWISTPRYSHGYASVRNRIGVLIETHMLKPYKDRVFSTKSLLEAILQFASENSVKLRGINQDADSKVSTYLSSHYYPIKFKITEQADTILYRGKEPYLDSSFIAGTKIKKYKQNPLNVKVPYYHYSVPVDSVKIPKYYILPKEFGYLAEKMRLQGITVNENKLKQKVHCEEIKFSDVKFSSFPYEGHFSPRFKSYKYETEFEIKKGDFIIPTNQPLLGLIIYLLEPKSSDSFLKWGFFNNIFEMKEYFEAYSMDPIAKKMYEENENLRKEFHYKLENDSLFAKNPRARLNFFYERSPYFDKKLNVYPVKKVYN